MCVSSFRASALSMRRVVFSYFAPLLHWHLAVLCTQRGKEEEENRKDKKQNTRLEAHYRSKRNTLRRVAARKLHCRCLCHVLLLSADLSFVNSFRDQFSNFDEKSSWTKTLISLSFLCSF